MAAGLLRALGSLVALTTFALGASRRARPAGTPGLLPAEIVNALGVRGAALGGLIYAGPRDRARVGAASGSGGSDGVGAQIWAIGLAVAAVQSWRVSMNTGNCRVVLAWCSPRVGYSATSFGHSSARAAPASSSARTVNVWAPTSTVILGVALRL